MEAMIMEEEGRVSKNTGCQMFDVRNAVCLFEIWDLIFEILHFPRLSLVFNFS
jgi:hypothetical protein